MLVLESWSELSGASALRDAFSKFSDDRSAESTASFSGSDIGNILDRQLTTLFSLTLMYSIGLEEYAAKHHLHLHNLKEEFLTLSSHFST